MKLLSKTLKTLSAFMLMFLFTNVAVAQYDDDYGDDDYDYGDDYYESDTGDDYEDDYYNDYNDDYTDDYNSGDNTGGDEKPQPKPYVRFEVPYDTITELVTYSEIVEVPTPNIKNADLLDYAPEDLVTADSFHYRAVQWMIKHFGPDTGKYFKTDYYDFDHEQWRLEVRNSFNLYHKSKHAQTPAGKVYFTIVLRLRDNRYKIQIDNLVHELPKTVNQKKPQRNYFEYYRETDTKVREYDRYLLAADRILKKMMEDLKTAIAPPAHLTVDREDF